MSFLDRIFTATRDRAVAAPNLQRPALPQIQPEGVFTDMRARGPSETVGAGFFSNGDAKEATTGSLFEQFNYYKYGEDNEDGLGTEPFTSSYEPISVGELRFRFGVVNKINDDDYKNGNN